MSDIRFFLPIDTDFSSQGENILPLIKCLETNIDNENWYVEVECPSQILDFTNLMVNASTWIYQGAIIVVPTNMSGDQPFKIGNPTLSDDVISFTARHIGYTSENYFLADVYPQNQTCQGSLDWIIDRTEPHSPFTAYSDMMTITSSRYVRSSLLAAFDSLRGLYGGHLSFNNFEVLLTSTIGNDHGESIEYGSNLQGCKVIEDWKSVVTKLLPIGNNELMLPETYLVADILYSDPYVKTVKFDVDTEEELRATGIAYLNTNKVPKINYTVKSDILQGVSIGDTISVKAPTFTLLTSVLAYKYDCLIQRIESVEFGNFRKDVKSVFTNIKEALENLGFKSDDLSTVVAQQSETINNLFQFGHAIHTVDATYYVDRLPKESAQQVMMLSLAGIGFSSTGIAGPFYQAWTLDGKLNTATLTGQSIEVANATVTGVFYFGHHRAEIYNDDYTMIRKV